MKRRLRPSRFGGRIVFFIHMLLVAIPIYGLAFATQYWQYLVLGLFVGLAGGSFAVGIAYTSAWFEKERQGTAMGIFGAGNAGAAITNLVAPLIVVAFGWRMVPQVYSVAMLVTAALFWFWSGNVYAARGLSRNERGIVCEPCRSLSAPPADSDSVVSASV